MSKKPKLPPYEEFIALNGGEYCGICGRPPKEGGRRLHRDHDHRSGKPRGLLCFRDNAALRYYMTPEWLRAAATYLDGKKTHTGQIIHGDNEAV